MFVVSILTISIFFFLSIITFWLPGVTANVFDLNETVTLLWWVLGTISLSLAIAIFIKLLPNSAPKSPKETSVSPNVSTGPTLRPTTLHNLSPVAFEHYCVEWARWVGYGDASVTRAVKDGGYDIEASRMIGQVKFQETPVGVKPIRELHGVAQNLGKRAAFFSLNGYSKEGKAEASSFGIALFTVKPFSAEIFADNPEAQRQLSSSN